MRINTTDVKTGHLIYAVDRNPSNNPYEWYVSRPWRIVLRINDRNSAGDIDVKACWRTSRYRAIQAWEMYQKRKKKISRGRKPDTTRRIILTSVYITTNGRFGNCPQGINLVRDQ